MAILQSSQAYLWRFTDLSTAARRPIMPALAILALSVFVFTQTVQVPINMMAIGLDASSSHVINLLAASPLMFGTDIVYTYGPLGYLLFGAENILEHWQIAFAVWFTLYAVFSVSLATLIHATCSGWQFAVATLLTLLVGPWVTFQFLLPALCIVLMLLRREKPQLGSGLLSLATGVASLTLFSKMPVGICCLASIVPGCLFPFRRRDVVRNLATVGILCLATCGLTWMALYGTLHGLGAYFVNSFDLAASYSANISYAPPNSVVPFRFLVVSVMLLACLAWRLPREDRWFYSALLAAPLFIQWKQGITRFDLHVCAFVSAMVFFAYLIWMRVSREHGIFRPLGVCAVIAVCLNQGVAFLGVTLPQMTLDQRQTRTVYLNDVRHLGPERLRQAAATDEQTLSPLLLAPKTREMLGDHSVDVWGYDLSLITANPSLNYRPKPIFQHICAYTSHLDRMNANFFKSPARPDFLFCWNTIVLSMDEHHMLFEDPHQQLEILNSYELASVEDWPQIMLLRHKEGRRFADPVVFKQQTVHWNENVPVPQEYPHDIFRARVKIQDRWTTTLRRIVERGPALHLVYVLADGTEHRYRLIPGHLEDGVWIKPCFPDMNSFRQFLQHQPLTSSPVVAVRFVPHRLSQQTPEIGLTWERISAADGAIR